ncbi:MAG: DUF4886 domain-containing protein [Candidatus Enteromonas sp.]|nr:DUF4886 domain-containing protein [Candidatus Enteromonas sp.]
MKHIKILLPALLGFALASCGGSSSSSLPSLDVEESSLPSISEETPLPSEEASINESIPSSVEESSSVESEEVVTPKKDWNEDGVLKILEIGNSYGEDTYQYSPDVLEALGVKNYVIGKMYYGGASIDDHYSFSQTDTRTHGSYEYRKIDNETAPNWSLIEQTSVLYAINDEEWDFVSIQQQSMDSTDSSTYSHLDDFLDFVETNNAYKDTKFVYNMTWAYPETNLTTKFVETYHSNTKEMYADIISTLQEVILPHEKFDKVLVPGTAVENARTSFLKSSLFRDDLHLSYDVGRYIAGLTYFVELVDGTLTSDFAYVPENISASQKEACIESAMNALSNKFVITDSIYLEDPDDGYNGIDKTIRLEAEDGVLDGISAKRAGCENASGGYIACDFNNCGQGAEWVHFAPLGGEHEVQIAYWTGAAGSKMALYLNEQKVTDVVFETATGWASGTNECGKVSVKLNLAQGYNTISLFKHGTASDSPEYGGWVQLDYLDIIGTGESYDPETLDFTPVAFTLQAEYGYFHTGGLPFSCDSMQGGYAVGEINAVGQGVDLYFKVPVDGNYGLKITYAQGGSNNNANVTFNDATTTFHLAAYSGQAWNYGHTSEVVLESVCSSSKLNYVSIVRSNSSDWFIVDSITLVPLA